MYKIRFWSTFNIVACLQYEINKSLLRSSSYWNWCIYLVSVSAFLIYFSFGKKKLFSRYRLDNYVMFKLLPGHFKMKIFCFIESKEKIVQIDVTFTVLVFVNKPKSCPLTINNPLFADSIPLQFYTWCLFWKSLSFSLCLFSFTNFITAKRFF